MLFKTLVALAVASLAGAETPTGFTPSSMTQLIVMYEGKSALNGAVEDKTATQNMPMLATEQRLNGTSYALIMVDMDIPTNNPPATSTLLHWMQTGLTPATTSTMMNGTSTSSSVFLLQNTSNTTPFAPYFGPNPPARIPLSHRYVQILVDTTGAPDSALTSLQKAAANRSGFSAESTLTEAGLQGKVVAGNFFNVTNPGPAAATKGNSSSGTPVTAAAAAQGSQSVTALVLFAAAVLVIRR